MHMIKWIRKNRSKIMTILLIAIMVTFVGGTALQQLLTRRHPARKTVATYAESKKINGFAINAAHSELEILRALGTPRFLLASGNIPAMILGQALFEDTTYAPYIYQNIKRSIMQGKLPADINLVNKFFDENTGDRGIVWILLNYEANSAGCAVSRQQAIETYKKIAPMITQGQSTALEVIEKISTANNITQESIMDVFAKLLSVLNYNETISTNSNVTLPEIDSAIGFEKETINAEYVKFDAKNYITDLELDDVKLEKQFESFKDKFAGEVTPDNPFGFGYKLSDRVQIEYMIIKLGDVAATIDEPTAEEMEQFYRNNPSRFTEQVASDPQNPESEKITRTKTYSEVAPQIKNMILMQKRDVKAEKILSDAKDIVEAELFDKNIEDMSGSQIKELAGDFKAAAEQTSKDFGIDIYSGKTGFLSKENLSKDMQLGMLMKQNGNGANSALLELAFAVEGLDSIKLSKFEGKAPKLYENIGPLKGMYTNTIALLRVVDFKKSEVPQDISISYSIANANLSKAETEDNIYRVKDDVENDCKLLSAMYVAKEKAEDFIETAGEDWDKAVEEYNSKKENADKIKFSKLEDRKRMSISQLNMIKMQLATMPGQDNYYSYSLNNKLLLDRIYDLSKKGQMAAVMEFEPEASVYVVKNINVKSADTKDYDELKQQIAASKETAFTIESALIQYNVENIKSRTNFKYVKDQQERSPEIETADEPEAETQNK